MPRPLPRAASFLWVTLAYTAALAVAWATVRALGPEVHPLWAGAAADAAATVAVFAFSVAFDNTSMYDPYWSVAPVALAPWLALRPETAAGSPGRKVLVIALVALWGVRLTYNWAVGYPGLGHEDWRYSDLRRKTGWAYWPVSLLGLHGFPTVLVYLGCLCLYPAFTSDRPLGVLDAAAAAVTLAAVAIEAVADEQLRAFRRQRRAPSEVISTGLWAYSRHPNYFGEVLFWWGLFLFAVAAGAPPWWSVTGAAAITLLFVFVSIPMIERRSLERKSGYKEYTERVSVLVPWFPRSG